VRLRDANSVRAVKAPERFPVRRVEHGRVPPTLPPKKPEKHTLRSNGRIRNDMTVGGAGRLLSAVPSAGRAAGLVPLTAGIGQQTGSNRRTRGTFAASSEWKGNVTGVVYRAGAILFAEKHRFTSVPSRVPLRDSRWPSIVFAGEPRRRGSGLAPAGQAELHVSGSRHNNHGAGASRFGGRINFPRHGETDIFEAVARCGRRARRKPHRHNSRAARGQGRRAYIHPQGSGRREISLPDLRNAPGISGTRMNAQSIPRRRV